METPPSDPILSSDAPAPETSVESVSGGARDIDSVADAGNEIEAPSETGSAQANSIEQAGNVAAETIDPGADVGQLI